MLSISTPLSEINQSTLPTVFRDQLYKHLETVPAGDFESFTNKLVQAGSTLEYLKYADALFEILLVGGLLQPGGSYIDDGAPMSPFSIFNAKEPVEVAEVKKYVEVLNKLIRRFALHFLSFAFLLNYPPLVWSRYKYLQRPLEASSLPGILQYINRWPEAQREKFSVAAGLILSQGLASASCLQSLTKDHLIKNGTPIIAYKSLISLSDIRFQLPSHLSGPCADVSISVVTTIFRAYLIDQSMEHLATNLRKGGIKDLIAFFPENKRQDKVLEEHFRSAGLPQVAEWWTKRQYASLKEGVISALKDLLSGEETHEHVGCRVISFFPLPLAPFRYFWSYLESLDVGID